MTKTPINAALDLVPMTPCAPPDNPNGLPYPTHEGIWVFLGVEIRVYVLNTGQRIIHGDDMAKLLEGIK